MGAAASVLTALARTSTVASSTITRSARMRETLGPSDGLRKADRAAWSGSGTQRSAAGAERSAPPRSHGARDQGGLDVDRAGRSRGHGDPRQRRQQARRSPALAGPDRQLAAVAGLGHQVAALRGEAGR